MSITADREIYALETRSESLESVSVGDFLRTGECDEIDVGTGTYLDNVDGNEKSHHGSLYEVFDHQLARECDSYSHAITGNARFDGTDDMWMVTGGMVDTEAGGSLFIGGQSDILCGMAGMRVTMLGDLWIAGLVGTEEKIATAVHDLVTVEFGALQFEREYGVGNHIGGYSYQSTADSDVTVANSFRPLFKHVTGYRDYTPAAKAARNKEKAEKKAAKAEKKAAKKAAKAEKKEASASTNVSIFSRIAQRRRTLKVVEAGETLEDASDLHRLSKVDSASKAEDAASSLQRVDDLLDAANDAASKPDYDAANNCTNTGPLDGRPRWEVESQQNGLQQQGNNVEWSNGKWQTKPEASKRPQFDPYESLDNLDMPPPSHSGGRKGGDPNYDEINFDSPPPTSSGGRKGGDSNYDEINFDSPPPTSSGGRKGGNSDYDDIDFDSTPPGAADSGGPAADPNAIYAALDKPPVELDPDAPPLPDRHNLSAQEIDNLGMDVPSPPIPERVLAEQAAMAAKEKWQDLIQSNEYRRYIESHGLEVKWDDGWHPVIDEAAGIVPKVGDFEYRNGVWVKGDTAVSASEFKLSAGASDQDVWGPLFDEHGYCISPGPYWEKPRHEVLASGDVMFRTEADIEWRDGNWVVVSPDHYGPLFNKQDICTSPGPFYGRPRTEVDGTKNLLEADGFEVEWVGGEWRRVEGSGPTGVKPPAQPKYRNDFCTDPGPNKGRTRMEVDGWKAHQEAGGKYKVEWIDGDWVRVGPGDGAGGGTPPTGAVASGGDVPPTGATSAGDAPSSNVAPSGGPVSPDGGPRFDGNKLCVDDGPFKNQPDYRVAEYKRNISENGKYEVEWVNGTWQRVASTADTVGNAGMDASKAVSPVYDTTGRCVVEGDLKGATRAEVDTVKMVKEASGQYKVEWIDGTWKRTADLAGTDEVDYQDFRRIFGHPKFDANGKCMDEGPFKGLSKEHVYSEFRRIHGTEAEWMEKIVWCNGTWMYEEDAYRRLAELGTFKFSMQSGPQFDVKGFCTSKGPYEGTFWDTVWQAEWDLLDDNKTIEWVNGNWVDTSSSGHKITENFENAAETGGAVTAATRPPPQTGADRMHHGNVYMAPGDNVAPTLPSRSQNRRFRGTSDIDALKAGLLEGRDPETYKRLMKLNGLSEMSSQQINDLNFDRITFNNLILKKQKRLKAGNKKINEALKTLNNTVDANAEKDWWKTAQDLRVKLVKREERAALSAASDGRHMVEAADGNMNWVEHLDELMRDDYAKVDQVDSPLVRQVNDHKVPDKMQVFGCVNPAVEPGQRIPDVPAYSAPFVGGTDGRHLVPQSGNPAEHVKATSVVEAIQGLDRQKARKVYGIEIDNVQKMEEIHRKLLEQIARRTGSASQSANAAEDAVSGGQNIAAVAADFEPYQELEAVLKATSTQLARSEDMATGGENFRQFDEAATAEDLTESDVLRNLGGAEGGEGTSSSWKPASDIGGGGPDEPAYATIEFPTSTMDETSATWSKPAVSEDGNALPDSSIGAAGETGASVPPGGVDSTSPSFRADGDAVAASPDNMAVGQNAAGGTPYDYDNWVEGLSNSAPPRTAGGSAGSAGLPPSPSRMQKIRNWFKELGARLRKLTSHSWDSDPDWAFKTGDDWASGDSAQELTALSDNVPVKLANTAAEGDSGISSPILTVPPEITDPILRQMMEMKAKLQKEGMGALDGIGLKAGDSLEDTSSSMKGLDNGLSLEESKVAQSSSTAEGAAGAGKPAAAGEGATGATGAAAAAKPGLTDTSIPPPKSVTGSTREIDGHLANINKMQEQAVNDGSRAALGSVTDARNYALDEVQRRTTELIRTHLDPDITDEAMGVLSKEHYSFGQPPYTRHPVHDIFEFLKQDFWSARKGLKEEEAVFVANKRWEVLRFLSDYLEQADILVRTKLVENSRPPTERFYNYDAVLDLLRADPEYQHYTRISQMSPSTLADSQLLDAEYGKALMLGEQALVNGEDAREVLARFLDSGSLGRATPEVIEARQYALGKFDQLVGAYCGEAGIPVPPVLNGNLFSNFDELNVSTLTLKLDEVDSNEFQFLGKPFVSSTDDATTGVSTAPVGAATSPEDFAAAVAPAGTVLKPLTEENAVQNAISPDYPISKIRGGEGDGVSVSRASDSEKAPAMTIEEAGKGSGAGKAKGSAKGKLDGATKMGSSEKYIIPSHLHMSQKKLMGLVRDSQARQDLLSRLLLPKEDYLDMQRKLQSPASVSQMAPDNRASAAS